MRQLLVLVALTSGCSDNNNFDQVVGKRQLPAALKEDATAIAQASNQFAVDLYGQLAAAGGNVFLSPFSISTALAMTDAGAAGTTDQELRAALRITLPGERMHTAYGAMLASLDVGRDFGAYTLATANRLFGQTGTAFLPDFLAITRRDYGAELMPVDFAGDTEAARRTINGWVADHTDDKIPELFEQGAITVDTLLVLANAIVFKGAWENEFKRDRTSQGPFRLANGSTVEVPMMNKRDGIALATIPGGTLGVLPFRGKDLSMIVIVPGVADGLPAIERQLSGEVIRQWIDSAAVHSKETVVTLPRFGITSEFDLHEALAKLGITSAFTPGIADFSGINGQRNLYVQKVVHKATISVDEAGAEAAAATGVGVVPTSLPPSLVADRPFTFAIYDHVTGAILFLGRVEDPTVPGQ